MVGNRLGGVGGRLEDCMNIRGIACFVGIQALAQ